MLASTSDLLWPLRTVSAKMPKLVPPDLKEYTHVAAKRPRRRRPPSGRIVIHDPLFQLGKEGFSVGYRFARLVVAGIAAALSVRVVEH